MGKKTIIPIKNKGYTMVTGSVANNTNTTVKFDKKVIMIFYNMVGVRYANGYYVDTTRSFFNGFENMFDTSYPKSKPDGYYNMDSSYYSKVTKIDDYTVNFYANSTNGSTIYYTAILEDKMEEETHSIFLLSGTILLTDGTPTTDMADAIQSIDTNKYKIKSNTLVNISNATYINLSN